MATSTFFNNYQATQTQSLYEDLLIQAIRIYGLDFYYLPRRLRNLDEIYLQDDISIFDRYRQIEMYVTSYHGFEGEGSIFTKFGLEIRDQMTFTIAARTFDNEIGQPFDIPRPRESDLVWYPLNNKLFEIKYVDNKPIHYPFGSLPTYEIKVELFEYSHEHFATGIPELDAIQDLSLNIYDYAILNEAGLALADENDNLVVGPNYLPDEIDKIEDNTELRDLANTVIDFSGEEDPWADQWPENL
jgi:hypothetical protein